METLGKADWTDPERVKRLADSYDQRYGKAFWQVLRGLTGSKRRDRILDLGCGPGLFLVDALSRYKAKRVIGLDASEVMLKQARRFLKGRLDSRSIVLRAVDFDSSETGLQDNTIDFAFSGFLLHELRNPGSLVAQVYRSLDTNGIYAVFEFVSGDIEGFENHMKQGGMSEADARNRYPHMCKYSLADLQGMLTHVGFYPVKYSLIGVRVVMVGLKGVK